MVICFKCPSTTKKVLDDLLQNGDYSDYAELISCAVENFAVLHRHLATKDSMIIETSGASAREALDVGSNVHLRVPREQSQRGRDKPLFASKLPSVPEIFLLDELINQHPTFSSLPTSEWQNGQEIPLNRWVFGQYNKLLPAKASCRALAHMLKNSPDGLEISKIAWQISEEAWALGDVLAAWDRFYHFHRDDALATAFPSTFDGRRRYANQFVASVTKEGQISGLLFDLKLINHAKEDARRILLTEAGWKFALMRSPVLDKGGEKPTRKFTEEETEFLLDHVTRNVPAEDFAYRCILKAIANGADNPDKIDAALLKHISRDAQEKLSKSFLSSQRSGAISRMTDLGLVKRAREGVKVSYLVTLTIGAEFLKGIS